MYRKILGVTEIRLHLVESQPPVLYVRAKGTVPTPRWREAELLPYVYIAPPPDGVYDFDFVGRPPHGVEPPVIGHLRAEHRLQGLPRGFRGVRVHASTNAKVEFLHPPAELVEVSGLLTDEAADCQALRAPDGSLFSLVGELRGFGPGDTVLVRGTVAEAGVCRQGTPIELISIERAAEAAAI
jgi:hypothetical protein